MGENIPKGDRREHKAADQNKKRHRINSKENTTLRTNKKHFDVFIHFFLCSDLTKHQNIFKHQKHFHYLILN